MKPAVFVDTAYLVALTNAADVHHARSQTMGKAWAREKRTFVTTDAGLIEYANFFARSPLRALAASAIPRLRGTRGWTIFAVERALLSRAEHRYAKHGDKSWSMTDCLSMEIMKDASLTAVATTDMHFAQAGFRPLMR